MTVSLRREKIPDLPGSTVSGQTHWRIAAPGRPLLDGSGPHPAHVKEGALQRLSAKPGKKREVVDTEAYDAIKRELQDKERAMADLSVELAILRKKTNGGSWDR